MIIIVLVTNQGSEITPSLKFFNGSGGAQWKVRPMSADDAAYALSANDAAMIAKTNQ